MKRTLRMGPPPPRYIRRRSSQNWHVEQDTNFMAKELIKAVMECDLESVTRLAAAGAPLNLLNDEGETLLCHVMRHMPGEEMPLCLINAGADINLFGRGSLPPLAVAIEKGKTGCAEEIINKGADIHIKFEVMALEARGLNRAVVSRDSTYTPLMASALLARTDIAGKLISSGVDVNQADENGCTALMTAARLINLNDIALNEDTEDIVKDSRGNVVKIIMTGVCMYDEPLKRAYLEILQMLVNAGADRGMQDAAGKAACDMTEDLDALDIIGIPGRQKLMLPVV